MLKDALQLSISSSADPRTNAGHSLCLEEKNGADFNRNEKCEITFQGLKRYLTIPPLVSKPSTRETLYMHLAVLKSVVSGALVREDESIQKPVCYVSHSMNSP